MFSSLMVVVSDVYILNMNWIYFIFYFMNCVVTVIGLPNITRKKFVFCNILILTISVGVHTVILTQKKRGNSVYQVYNRLSTATLILALDSGPEFAPSCGHSFSSITKYTSK